MTSKEKESPTEVAEEESSSGQDSVESESSENKNADADSSKSSLIPTRLQPAVDTVVAEANPLLVASSSPLYQLDFIAFRRLGVATLVLQALSTIAFSWYAWHIENPIIGFATLFILHPWFLLTSWKTAIAYTDNCFLYRVSCILTLISMNPYILYTYPDTDTEANDWRWIAVSLAGHVFCLAVLLGSLEVVGMSLRQSMVHDQERLDSILLESLAMSIKAGLIVIYLEAQAVSGVGGKSVQEMLNAIGILKNRDESDPAEYSYEEYMEATEVFQGSLDAYKATTSGGTLFAFLFISFVVTYVASLSLTDVATLRFSVSEGIVVIAAVVLAVVALVFLGVLSTPVGTVQTAYVAFPALIEAATLTAAVCCGVIAHSIAKGRHPYHHHRCAQHLNFSNIQQGQQESIPFMSEEA